MKRFWLLVTFFTLVVLPAQVGMMLRESCNPDLAESYLATAQMQIDKGNEDGALAIWDFLATHDLDETGVAMASYTAVIAKQNQISAKVYRGVTGALKGYVLGEVTDPASLAGCTAGDLMVWGDVRDLIKNGYVYCTGGETDTLIVALSSIGLATTLAPHLDVGISVAKTFARFMSKTLRAGLELLVTEAKATGKLDKVTGLLSSLGTTYRRIGMGTLDLVQFSKDSAMLTRLAGIVESYGRAGYGAIMLGGKSAVTFLGVALDAGVKLTGAAGKRIMRFGLQYPKWGARALKVAK
ncbi:MAG TPA: hypothetical protein PKO06_04265, partial [Candidatus Ozemobacteraceae bacterium]|nr:hypothetical protein [Candidatus Ozemobacteraceae bacterium]